MEKNNNKNSKKKNLVFEILLRSIHTELELYITYDAGLRGEVSHQAQGEPNHHGGRRVGDIGQKLKK